MRERQTDTEKTQGNWAKVSETEKQHGQKWIWKVKAGGHKDEK